MFLETEAAFPYSIWFWILTKGVKRQPVRHQTYSPSFLDHVSRVTCHMSRVTFHISRVTCHNFFFDKVVKLISGGSVINRAYPV
jgi:hypothetical protein